MIIEIIIITSFVLLTIFALLCLISQSPKPTCKQGQSVSNILSGEERSYPLTYTPGVEICHDKTACNNPLAPCVYQENIGTICPGDIQYTGVLPPGGRCLPSNKKLCPVWASNGFKMSKEYYFLQTDLNIEFCGIQEDNLVRIWPSECVRGKLGYNENDNLWYCINTSLTCPNQTYLRLGNDYVASCTV